MTDHQHVDELLIDRAIWGDADASIEQAVATLGADSADPSFDGTAAAIAATYLFDRRHTAPPAVVQRLETAAIGYFVAARDLPAPDAALSLGIAPRRASTGVAAPSDRALLRLGWLAAAAALILLLLQTFTASGPTRPEAAREHLIASADDLLRIDWKAGPSELRGNPTGDVVWSDAQQAGFMRLRGLPANDRSAHQYQLWIFDRQRSADRPVDGGVFDVPPDLDEVVVPIDAKIAVYGAFAFAVTVEPPGGVVVSDREHIVVTAGL